jgi:hypothetical protein
MLIDKLRHQKSDKKCRPFVIAANNIVDVAQRICDGIAILPTVRAPTTRAGLP